MTEIEIRLLQRPDDRSTFSCGEPALDRFFQHYAGQNQFKLRLAVSWVAVRDTEILGFTTLSVGSIERRTVPDERLRRRLPDYPLPMRRLARLGVDQRARGIGIGRALVRHVLKQALVLRDQAGCVGVVTDAKRPAVSFYERLGFAPLTDVREGLLHGDPTPMFLSIQAIEAAVRATER